jgi:putative NIF3 family GTP cyclohydrolase 1 type 2
VPEARLEMILPATAREAALAALRSAHPYEEPAVDFYPLLAAESAAGLGRVGRLPAPLAVAELAGAVAAALDLPAVARAGEGTVETVALLPGAGGEALAPALAAGAQALVTGELRYHESCDALAAGLALLTAGHAESEAPLLPALAAALQEQFGDALHLTVEPPAPLWR